MAGANGHRLDRFTRDTQPPDPDEDDRGRTLVRSAIHHFHAGGEHRGQVKDRVLIILAMVALAAVVGFGVALAVVLARYPQ